MDGTGFHEHRRQQRHHSRRGLAAVLASLLAAGVLPLLPAPASAEMVHKVDGKTWVSDVENRTRVAQVMDRDGDRLLVGSAGATYVFDRAADGTWSETAKLGGGGGSVSLSGDRAAIGKSDGAHVYVRQPNGTWTEEAHITSPFPTNPDEDGEAPNFGASVAIDGDRLVVGAPGVDWDLMRPDVGRAVLYERQEGVWQEVQRWYPSPVYRDAAFGRKVAIDGDTTIVAAPTSAAPTYFSIPDDAVGNFIHFQAGSVWVFDGTEDITSGQRLKSFNGIMQAANFGLSLSLDGDTLVVGAPDETQVEFHAPDQGCGFGVCEFHMFGVGAAYSFQRQSDGTFEPDQRFVPFQHDIRDPQGPPGFGNSVSVSGNRLAIGASKENFGLVLRAGEVYSYARPDVAGEWVETDRLSPPDMVYRPTDPVELEEFLEYGPDPRKAHANGDEFGGSVAMAGDELIIGAPGDFYQADDEEYDFFDHVDNGSISFTRFVDEPTTWVTIDQAADQAEKATTAPIEFEVQFARAVSGFGPADIDLSESTAGGTLVPTVHSVSFHEGRYLVKVTGMTTNGQVIAKVRAGAATAPDGPTEASTSTDNVVGWDGTRPTVTVAKAAGQDTPTGAEPVRYTVTFSEPVSGFTADDVHITTGGTKTVTGGPAIYEVALTAIPSLAQHLDGWSDGRDLTIELLPDAAKDAFGNTNVPATHLDTAVHFDSWRPEVVVKRAPGQASVTGDAPVRFTATFSEPVTGFDDDEVTFVDDQGGALEAAVSGGPSLYDIEVTGMVDAVRIELRIAEGVAHDGPLGLPNRAVTTAPSVQYNPAVSDRPTATVALHPDQDQRTATSPIRYIVTFSEPVTVFGDMQRWIEHSTLDTEDLTVSRSGSGTTYTISVSGMDLGSEGTVVLSVPEDAALDPGGNRNFPFGPTEESTVTWAGLLPEATIDRADDQADPTSDSPVRFKVTFSEPVTGFGVSDLRLFDSDAGGPLVGTIEGGPTEYIVNVAGMTKSGPVVLGMINQSAVENELGVPNDFSTAIDNRVNYSIIPFARVDLGEDRTGTEGSDVVLEPTVADQASVKWTYTAGADVDAGATCTFADDTAVATTVRCTDDGTFTLKLTATGTTGTPTRSDTAVLHLANAAPTIGAIAGPARVDLGTAATLTAPVDDLGDNDTLRCSANWGDGRTTTGSVVFGVCLVSRTYEAVGTYTVSILVVDDEGAPTLRSTTITVGERGEQEITFDPLTTPHAFGDAPFTVSATADSGLPVAFTASGACTVEGNTVTITLAAWCSVAAHQAGNEDFRAAESVTRSFKVAKGAQSIDFTLPESVSYGHAPIPLSATASSGATVGFTVVSGPCVIEAGNLRINGAGTCVVKAASPFSYEYETATKQVSVIVDKVPLTITASGAGMFYGGTSPLVVPVHTGFIPGDGPSRLTTQATCGVGSLTRPVGEYPGATTCSGATSPNYEITFVPGKLNVGPAPLTVVASDATMPYGGPAATVTPSYDGFVLGDDADDLPGAPTCFVRSGATSFPAGLHEGDTLCSGSNGGNYLYVYQAGDLTITKRTLTVTPDDATKVYGQPVPAFTHTISGFVLGQGPSVVTGAPSLTTPATASSSVGTYPISGTVGSLEATNYDFELEDGTLEITQAPLSITASSSTMTYGGAVPAVTASYAGFVLDDGPADLLTAPTCAGGSSTTAAGTHVDGTVCTGATSANYVITNTPGTLTVAPAPLAVMASDLTMTYGEAAPVVLPSYAGFVNDEGPSDLAAAPTCSGGSPTMPAGTYLGGTTCRGAAAANYVISYWGGTLTVLWAELTVTAADATKVYGEDVPTLTYAITGFVNDETEAVLSGAPTVSTTATATSPVGTYPITVVAGTLTAPNYVVTYVPAELTITRAPLTVTADDKTKVHGEAIPPLTYSVTGFVNGEGASVLDGAPTLSTTATATSGVGTYPIAIAPGTLEATNYALSFTNGVLTVTPAATALRADPAIISLNPLQLRLGRGSAHLTIPGSTQSLEGRTIVFTAGSRVLCTATTDATGTASCAFELADSLAVVLALGYTATFEGAGDYLPSSGAGALIG